MVKKVKYYLPMIALVTLVLGSCYIGALDEKKTAEVETSGQITNELNN